MISIAIEALIKSALIAFVLLTAFAYLTFAERKIAALMQVRKGPNRVGPWGLLQPAADGIKLIFKEEVMPAEADKVLFFLAPMLTMIPAIVIVAVIRAHKVRFLVYIADAAVVGESPNVKSKVELKSKVFKDFVIAFGCVS